MVSGLNLGDLGFYRLSGRVSNQTHLPTTPQTYEMSPPSPIPVLIHVQLSHLTVSDKSNELTRVGHGEDVSGICPCPTRTRHWFVRVRAS